ncbi:MAG: hypothetical protein WAN23_00830, partial [Candidatus Acidiferrales bacterium]
EEDEEIGILGYSILEEHQIIGDKALHSRVRIGRRNRIDDAVGELRHSGRGRLSRPWRASGWLVASRHGDRTDCGNQ